MSLTIPIYLALLAEAAMDVQQGITTMVSTTGQIVLPKAIRDKNHRAAGTKLIIEETVDGVLLKLAPVFALTDIASAFGSLRSTKPTLSIDGMSTVIAEEAKRRARD
ncbi:hypothetical protein M527_24515 [Sphingobium indicum IP26]|nr:hypothetical protein M527_24515 [Sphingobium indicum IP26]